MATGRTLSRWAEVYLDGYYLCSSTRTIGPLVVDATPPDTEPSLCDAVRGGLPTHVRITPGTLNGIMNFGSNNEVIANIVSTWVGSGRPLTVVMGIRGTAAAGDPTFNGKFYVDSYQAEASDGAVLVNVGFGDWDAAALVAYQKPWGKLIHALATRTAANSATGGVNNGAASAAGGYMMWHAVSNGTYTLSIDDSADDSTYGALSGATTGEISATTSSGIVALSPTATVKQYLRWQLALNSATYVQFVLSFVRG
jgi:hypothetical protein